MESKIFLLLAIIAHAARTGNSSPLKNFPNSDVAMSSSGTSIASKSSETTETRNSEPVVVPETEQREMKTAETETAVVDKRSIREDDEEPSLNAEKNYDDLVDLETAAGTNVLRPLFVYRQQLAYRKRVRNAGRRDVANF